MVKILPSPSPTLQIKCLEIKEKTKIIIAWRHGCCVGMLSCEMGGDALRGEVPGSFKLVLLDLPNRVCLAEIKKTGTLLLS